MDDVDAVEAVCSFRVDEVEATGDVAVLSFVPEAVTPDVSMFSLFSDSCTAAESPGKRNESSVVCVCCVVLLNSLYDKRS